MSVEVLPAAAACVLCGSRDSALVSEIVERPSRETDFGIPRSSYQRQVRQCRGCSVYLNVHQMLGADFYDAAYNLATYDRDLGRIYDRVRQLPVEQSDNKQRVQRVLAYQRRAGRASDGMTVLDVGSGSCVFLGELRTHGVRGFCVDPDPVATAHARARAGVEDAYTGTLEDVPSDRRFDLVAFNKVLEHLTNPIETLGRARDYLAPGGAIYIEVPDGESALRNGGAIDREEFYVEHVTVFTMPSLNYLAERAGLRVSEADAIHEPSDKYTLYAFMQ